LAHVDVSEIANTGLGSSEEELEEEQRPPPPAAKFLSRGLLRGQESRVLALRSTSSVMAVAAAQGDPASPVASMQASLHQEVTTAFVRPEKARKEASVAELARQLAEQIDARAKSRIGKENLELTRVAEARVKGYEGESCRECGNFTLVRNGTCLKCDTCGGTSGCS
jgi:ribonucleoside-diphosphate reductase alpha chain